MGNHLSKVENPSTARNTFGLMAAACLLIANSHLEPLYPKSWLAADGLLGNSIFFFLAGYGVTKSQSSRPYGLGLFYLRRIIRIYPSLILVTFIGILIGYTTMPQSPLSACRKLIWPTDYGFIKQVMVFYPVGWWIARFQLGRIKLFVICSGLLWIFTLFFGAANIPSGEQLSLGTLPQYFWWSFFFLVFLTGGFFGRSDRANSQNQTTWFFIALLALTCYLALKLLYTKGSFSGGELPTMLSAASLQGLVLLIVICTLKLLPLLNRLLSAFKLEQPFSQLGKSSLQVYLSHSWFILPLHGTPIPWWAKVVVFFLLAIATSIGLRLLVESIQRGCSSLLRSRNKAL